VQTTLYLTLCSIHTLLSPSQNILSPAHCCLHRPSFYVTRALLSPSTKFLCHPRVAVFIDRVSMSPAHCCIHRPSFYVTRALLSSSTEFLCHPSIAVSIDQVSMSPARCCLYRLSFYVTRALLSPSTEFLCHPQVAVSISRVSKPYAPWAVSIDPISMLSVRCYLRYTLYSILLSTFQAFATLYNLRTFNYSKNYPTCLFLQLISLKVRHLSFSQGIECFLGGV
jgi:hypothetical protein